MTKDPDALRDLFYEEQIVWRAVGRPTTRAAISQALGMPRPFVEDDEGGAWRLLEGEFAEGATLEERFYQPVIYSDGSLATVVFGYEFARNGEVANWGNESWQLVRTEDGWRIVHLMFTYALTQVEPSAHTQTPRFTAPGTP